MYWRIGTGIVLTILLWFLAPRLTSAAGPSFIPTFHSIGISWSPTGGSSSVQCTVQYRIQGTTAWKNGYSLWFDTRPLGANRVSEYRGSIVNLQPNTTYEVNLILSNGTTVTGISKTWNENFPVAKTIYLPGNVTSPYTINEGGSASGYIVYTHQSGQPTTVNVGTQTVPNIKVNASYVIIRDLTIKGGKYGILIDNNAHDVVIEDNDISGWGTSNSVNEGAIHLLTSEGTERVIIQRNKIHHPRIAANNWTSGHPRGPQGIRFDGNTNGNHVVRYNEFFTDDTHYFRDIMNGGGLGFPYRDSDIYGNYVERAWDNGIETEGVVRNVRIWSNYITKTLGSIAMAPINEGPVYVFRNIGNVNNRTLTEFTGPFIKLGSATSPPTGMGGKIYIFHNTVLQPRHQMTGELIGASAAIGNGPVENVVTRNNIFHARNTAIINSPATLNNYDYDLYWPKIDAYTGAEPNGIKATPGYTEQPFLNNAIGRGIFALSSSSPGYDKGIVLPNFSDGFTGAVPDMGAHEAGTPPMQFGVNAYQSESPTPTTGTTPTAIPTNIATLTGLLTPISSPETTNLNIIVLLHGIGKGGDNVNPNATGNMSPVHPQRQVNMELFDAHNQSLGIMQGTVNFNPTVGSFTGVVNIGTAPGGVYTGRVKIIQFLGKAYPGILNIKKGQTNTLPTLSLTTGDANNDNRLSVLDYNVIIDCYADSGLPKNCTDTTKKQMADLTDDNSVNMFDYNLFLREMSQQGGDGGGGTPGPTNTQVSTPTPTLSLSLTPIVRPTNSSNPTLSPTSASYQRSAATGECINPSQTVRRKIVCDGQVFDGYTGNPFSFLGSVEDRDPTVQKVIKNCTFRNSRPVAVVIEQAQNVLIENSTFHNIRSGQAGQDRVSIDICHTSTCNVNNITIRGSSFTEIGSDGVHVGATARNSRNICVENNTFVGREDVGENAIDVKGTEGPVYFTSNKVSGFRPCESPALGGTQDCSGHASGPGIVIHSGTSGRPKNVYVEGNEIWDNNYGIVFQDSDNSIFRGNYIRDNLERGLNLWTTTTTILVENNRFVNNPLHINVGAPVTQCTFRNNTFSGGTIGSFGACISD